MQKKVLIFSTACCFILAGLNLFLNYRLYYLVNSEMNKPAVSDGGLNDAAVFAQPPSNYIGAQEIAAADLSFGTAEAAPLYILGIKDGYIAVYYGSGGGKNVREITALPVNALPSDEKMRLTQGIPVYDEDRLAKLLQDYGS